MGGVGHFVGQVIVFQVIAAHAVGVFDLGKALEAGAGGWFEEKVFFFVHDPHPGKQVFIFYRKTAGQQGAHHFADESGRAAYGQPVCCCVPAKAYLFYTDFFAFLSLPLHFCSYFQ